MKPRVASVLFCIPFGLLFAAEPVDYVNPLIGTGAPKRSSEGSHVAIITSTVPSISAPFGMTQWLPLTRLNEPGKVVYDSGDTHLLGFIGSHHPAIWMGDYGQVSLMPGTGPIVVEFDKRKQPFSHADEVCTPYSYKVTMGGPLETRITTEFAPTVRAVIMRFTFPEGQTPNLVVDASREYSQARYADHTPADGWVKIDAAANEIVGYNKDRHYAHLGAAKPSFAGYFLIQFDHPVTACGTAVGGVIKAGAKESRADQLSAYVQFAAGTGTNVVVARIGTSFISVEQARENLRREIPGWDLEPVKAQGRAVWNAQLSRIRVEGKDEDAKHVFYTCLYHAHLYPRTFSEYGRYYSAFDDAVHAGEHAYNDYSLWDTFRALHPLLTLTAPERVAPMVTSLLQMYREGGWLPLWPNPGYTGMMIGSPADSVIADAWQKGLRGFDLALAYEAVRKSATVPQAGDVEKTWPNVGPYGSGLGCNGDKPETRGGLSGYMRLGYVPADTCLESSSRTLEYAYEDFCDAVLAQAAGHTEDAALFLARSKNYRNVIKDGKLWARTTAGEWVVPKVEVDITEGDAWSYLFCAMQDVPGLAECFGGRDGLIAKLDENFAKHNVHGNEPQHHYPYLYDYVGQPWKTQAVVREYLATKYRNAGSGGYDGDEDCGQMSAWYVFSALGFYPVAPGSGEYAIGSPLFDEAAIAIGAPYAPAVFKVAAQNQSSANRYIQSAALNGVPITRPFLRHADIVKGGSLVFAMGPLPNETWGVGK